MNAISNHLSFFLHEVSDYISLVGKNMTDEEVAMTSNFNAIIESTLKDMIEVVIGENALNNAFVEEEAKNVLSSILSMSKPSLRFIDYRIKELEDSITVSEKYSNENNRFGKDYPIQHKKLLELYKKQRMKSK